MYPLNVELSPQLVNILVEPADFYELVQEIGNKSTYWFLTLKLFEEVVVSFKPSQSESVPPI